ncbi:hypothetical protein BDP27DRAFT_1488808 [Rhodocollybia butyracea]|uniref:Uncharacterized protein n=1 Tax=Rhodocollybia butyracea TaxID=206335 RepID=A0A9P5TZX0_9AGAR|nr:hypothetical protein BDP27DRAFT_1488808 [Rhodocollybia butyracea]
MTFTLDNNSTSKMFTYEPFDSLQLPGFSNFEYFSQDNLTPGNHTLITEVTQIQGGGISAVIDYLTYTPSWTFLFEKPNFANSNSTNNTMGEANSHETKLTTKEKTSIITGSVIGGVITLAMICLFFMRLFRFLKKSPTQLEDSLEVIEPFPIEIDKATLHQSSEPDGSSGALNGTITVHTELTPPNATPEVLQLMQDVLNRMARSSTDVGTMQPPAYESERGTQITSEERG